MLGVWMHDTGSFEAAEQSRMSQEVRHPNGSEEFADALVEQTAADAQSIYGKLHRPNLARERREAFWYPNVARLVESSFEEGFLDVNET